MNLSANKMENTNYKIATAIQQGSSHIYNGNKPCQDAVVVKQTNNLIFLGLADGAGSYKYAGYGAKYILKQLKKEFEKNLHKYLDSNNIQHDILDFIEYSLNKYANKTKIDFEEFSSTLLVIVIYDDKYLALRIGDGIIFAIDNNNNPYILSMPENGQYSNETYFTTTTSYIERLRIFSGYKKDISNGVCIVSDGIEDLLYNYQTLEVMPLVKIMIDWLDTETEENVSNILKYHCENTFSKKSDDDMSIIIYKEITDESI